MEDILIRRLSDRGKEGLFRQFLIENLSSLSLLLLAQPTLQQHHPRRVRTLRDPYSQQCRIAFLQHKQ